MDIRQLTTFQTIVATGNFTKTATLLGYTQSAVSSQIKKLEQELNAPLFTYEHRQLTLTNTAKRLLPLTQHLLNDFEAIQALQQTDEMTGTLRVAAPESLTIYRLPPILAQFRRAYPHVQLQITNATCQFNQQQLLAGEADLAFMLWPQLNPTTTLTDHDLGPQTMSLITSPTNTADFETLMTTSSLPWIINEPDCSYRNQFENALWQRWHFRPTTMELWSLAAIKQMVASDVGYSYLPTLTIQTELQQHQLRVVSTPINNEIHAHLLTRTSGDRSPLIQAFVDLVLANWPK